LFRLSSSNRFKRSSLQIRFHDLRHACITKLAESQASEHPLGCEFNEV